MMSRLSGVVLMSRLSGIMLMNMLGGLVLMNMLSVGRPGVLWPLRACAGRRAGFVAAGATV